MMSNANDDAAGYSGTFEAYLRAGWKGVLALKARHKWPPPPFTKNSDTHFTGYAGIFPSYADMMTWADDPRLGNIALRLPHGIIGIDVDAYDSQTGGATLAEAMSRWGDLPDAPRSSSREGDAISGIRLFRVPEDAHLQTKIDFPELGIGDIEIIQFHHRYAMCWPSIHPEGRRYRWRNDADQLIDIPKPEELPELPAEWLTNLRVQPNSQLNGSIEVGSTLTAGDPSFTVSERLRMAIRDLNTPGTSRHDAGCRHTLAMMRLGKSGEPGVRDALQTLGNVFVAAVISDGSRTLAQAQNEYMRMINGDNAARELANPSITDWVRELIIDEETPATPDQRPIESSPATPTSEPSAESSPGAPELDGAVDGNASVENAPSDNEGRDQDPIRPRSPLEDIEQGFWESRESLAMIWQTARAKMCSPWAVLGICAARALHHVRPCVTLPDIIGGPGSLNWFTAIVAPSGRGKGAAGSCARLLVPEHVYQKNLGTGEGVVDAFVKPGNKESGEPRSWRESVLLTADESDTLSALKSRSGSTLMSVLRSGFSGETLGFSYRSNSDHLEAHTYRMTMILSVQPERADWLINDAAGGTPQRLMWFPATDNRVRRKDRPWAAGALTLPHPSEWLYPREIIVPPEAVELIEQASEDRHADKVDALDGHALFCREKFAYALTVLDGRVEMTPEDWELSGIAAEISVYTRGWIVETLREASRIDALDRGETRGIEMAAADESKQYEEAERVRHALRWALGKLDTAGPGGIPIRELTQAADSRRTRRWLPAALQVGQSNGLIRQLDGTTTWVKI